MDKSLFDNLFFEQENLAHASFGTSATYTPLGGSATTVNVLVDDYGMNIADRDGNRSRMYLLRGSVRVSEVESLGRGDTFKLAGENVSLRVIPESVQRDGIAWQFDAVAIITLEVGDVAVTPNR